MLKCATPEEIYLTVEYVEKVYNRYSSIYDLTFGKVFHGRELASELLDLSPGAQLLEVGVGTGLSIPPLPKNIQVTGVDLSQKMLALARKRLDELDSHHVQLFRMDATKLEFPDNSFDRILAAYFISVVPDPVGIIQELKRVCRPGGYLVFLNHFRYEVPLVKTVETFLSPLFYRLGFRTDLDLHSLMEESHLHLDIVENIDVLGHWKIARCINLE